MNPIITVPYSHLDLFNLMSSKSCIMKKTCKTSHESRIATFAHTNFSESPRGLHLCALIRKSPESGTCVSSLRGREKADVKLMGISGDLYVR